MQDVAGKVAVVTGGASGIGLALAQRFLTEGSKVMLADVERDTLETAEKDLAETFGAGNVGASLTDVRDPSAVEALAEATFDRFGTAHIVCNNAGVAVGGFAWTIADDRWRWIVDVNLMGVVNGIRAFVPRMVEQGEGHVVNTASVAGLVTAPLMSPYVATKHAVVALSESLYMDLRIAEGDIGVSVLCPGWVRTNIADSERNRPLDVSPSEIELAAGDRPSMLQSMLEQGMDPAEVAGKVIDAVRAGRFWILTHATSRDAVKQRFQAIDSDGQPAFSTF
jgi:NAD(P)-dependent dehydrogenase (short-subunit alcohol dehydrogenase family)